MSFIETLFGWSLAFVLALILFSALLYCLGAVIILSIEGWRKVRNRTRYRRASRV